MELKTKTVKEKNRQFSVQEWMLCSSFQFLFTHPTVIQGHSSTAQLNTP